MNRRKVLGGIGIVSVAFLSGCSSLSSDNGNGSAGGLASDDHDGHVEAYREAVDIDDELYTDHYLDNDNRTLFVHIGTGSFNATVSEYDSVIESFIERVESGWDVYRMEIDIATHEVSPGNVQFDDLSGTNRDDGYIINSSDVESYLNDDLDFDSLYTQETIDHPLMFSYYHDEARDAWEYNDDYPDNERYNYGILTSIAPSQTAPEGEDQPFTFPGDFIYPIEYPQTYENNAVTISIDTENPIDVYICTEDPIRFGSGVPNESPYESGTLSSYESFDVTEYDETVELEGEDELFVYMVAAGEEPWFDETPQHEMPDVNVNGAEYTTQWYIPFDVYVSDIDAMDTHHDQRDRTPL